MSDMEHDEYIQVWTFTAESALELFGLTPKEYEVTVLKDKPTTEHEIAKYRPEVKLFGVKRRASVTAVTGDDLFREQCARLAETSAQLGLDGLVVTAQFGAVRASPTAINACRETIDLVNACVARGKGF